MMKNAFTSSLVSPVSGSSGSGISRLTSFLAKRRCKTLAEVDFDELSIAFWVWVLKVSTATLRFQAIVD